MDLLTTHTNIVNLKNVHKDRIKYMHSQRPKKNLNKYAINIRDKVINMQFLQIIANFMGCAHRNMCILHEDTHIEILDMCIVLVLCTIAYLRPYQYRILHQQILEFF